MDLVALDGFQETSPELRPYLRLWASVMRIGITDFCTARANGDEVAEEVQWFWSDALHAGSFLWLCELFGFDPSKARTQVLARWREYVDGKQIFNTRGRKKQYVR